MKTVLSVLAGVLVVCSFITGIVIINTIGTGLGFVSLAVSSVIVLIAYLVMWFPYTKYQNAIDAYNEAKEKEHKSIEDNLRKKQESIAQDIMFKLDQIKKTIIVETHTGKDNVDTMNRGIVGALLFGTTGAIVGTATAEDKTYTTFLIIFNDDTRITQSVENGSTLYNHYIKFLEV